MSRCFSHFFGAGLLIGVAVACGSGGSEPNGTNGSGANSGGSANAGSDAGLSTTTAGSTGTASAGGNTSSGTASTGGNTSSETASTGGNASSETAGTSGNASGTASTGGSASSGTASTGNASTAGNTNAGSTSGSATGATGSGGMSSGAGNGGGAAGGASTGAAVDAGATDAGTTPVDCSKSPAPSRDLFVDVLGKKQADVDAKVNTAFQSLFHGGTDATGDPLQTTTNAAPDGEEYFATALILASRRWGDGTGIFAYSSEAKALLDAMVHKGETPDAQAGGITSMFDPTAKMVVFVPSTSTDSSTFTDPSYHVPAFYEIWACFDAKNGPFWKTVAANSRSFFQKATDPTTGLAPEYAAFDGTPSTRSQKGDFRYDAWRVVSNVMTDHRFWNADPWQTTYAAKLGAFFQSQGRYNDEYTLSGMSLDGNHSEGIVAMNATLGFALSAASAKPFVQELWDTAVPTGQYRYYNGMLYMLGLLHASGKFTL